MASSFREQIYLTVDYMPTDGLSIRFGEIAIIFGVTSIGGHMSTETLIGGRSQTGRKQN
jgi:hypothetical protein